MSGMPGPEAPALEFLRCRTPDAWVDAAVADLDLVLQDHATLELKAAQQAQTLIRRYGAANAAQGPAAGDSERFRAALIHRMSRLAREELRHFEQVIEILAARGQVYRRLSPSGYAAGLHAQLGVDEPGRLIDTLLVSAIIEARSCERFACLVPALARVEPELAKFYSSLLRSEARHYQDYVRLARVVARGPDASSIAVDDRLAMLLDRERLLVSTPDTQLRFHSGPPGPVLNPA